LLGDGALRVLRRPLVHPAEGAFHDRGGFARVAAASAWSAPEAFCRDNAAPERLRQPGGDPCTGTFSSGSTPAANLERYGLPPDYRMIAPSYAAQRSAGAKAIGLGQQGARLPDERRPDLFGGACA
jgi:hypothetical protein